MQLFPSEISSHCGSNFHRTKTHEERTTTKTRKSTILLYTNYVRFKGLCASFLQWRIDIKLWQPRALSSTYPQHRQTSTKLGFGHYINGGSSQRETLSPIVNHVSPNYFHNHGFGTIVEITDFQSAQFIGKVKSKPYHWNAY